MQKRVAVVLVALAGLLAACGEDAPPPERSAQQGLDQFAEAIGEMEEKKDRLEAEVDELRSRFDDQLDKHLSLLRDRLIAYETRLTRLPAEREVELRQAHQRLADQTAQVRQRYEAWSGAEGEQAAAARAQLDEARAKLDDAFEAFDSELAGAEGQ